MIEREVFCQLLDRLDDELGNAGCNDFTLPNTPENRNFAKRVLRHGYDDEKDVDQYIKNMMPEKDDRTDEICLCDFHVLGYLRSLYGLET